MAAAGLDTCRRGRRHVELHCACHGACSHGGLLPGRLLQRQLLLFRWLLCRRLRRLRLRLWLLGRQR